MRFVVVNDRMPRAATFCALCCEPITESYVREHQDRQLEWLRFLGSAKK